MGTAWTGDELVATGGLVVADGAADVVVADGATKVVGVDGVALGAVVDAGLAGVRWVRSLARAVNQSATAVIGLVPELVAEVLV